MAIYLRVKISDKNEAFLKKIEELSDVNVRLCFQCGECTSSCPLAHEMDVLPSTLMRLVQLGQEDVLESKAIWVCSSCFNCYARCPRDIDVAAVIETLRQVNLRKKMDHVNLNEIPKEDLRRLPQMALISNLRKFTS